MASGKQAGERPNVVLVLADDLGFSDLGCYGAEIETPNLDALAASGVRMTQFTTTARCSPSRASLLTGLHPHQTGIGILTGNDGPGGYQGSLNDRCLTVAEVLQEAGYATYMSGKWHLANNKSEPNSAWPTRRGFEQYYGTLAGWSNYFTPRALLRNEQDISDEPLEDPDFYYTDAITDAAVGFIRGHGGEDPFFCYVSYTAPHFPLHAREADIQRCLERYREGWDAVREQRVAKMRELGILGKETEVSQRDPEVAAWEDADHHEWEQRRMAVYAAMVESMDTGVGQIVESLRDTGKLENTILVFLSDNGGCERELPAGPASAYLAMGVKEVSRTSRDGREVQVGPQPQYQPGGEDTCQMYGRAWANVSNTPFRLFKTWTHQGGIASPFIVHWPEGLGDQAGAIIEAPHYLPDFAPTVYEAAGVTYPDEYAGRKPLPLEGVSMLRSWRGEPGPEERCQFYEHEGNAAVRRGPWKLVRVYPGDWELYNLDVDPAELHDLAAEHRDIVTSLAYEWADWAARSGVVVRERILELKRWGIGNRLG